MTDMYLRFQDQAEALEAIATATASTVEDIPAVGDAGGNRWEFYAGIPPGEPTEQTDPETGEPVIMPKPGIWVVGRWRGTDPVPALLASYSVEPWGQIIG